MWTTSLGRLRLCGWIEGISYLLLLGVAMPLKYMMDMPMAVRWVGLAHGVLWLVYVSMLFTMYLGHTIYLKHLLGGLFASVMPFGPFVFERYLPSDDESADNSDE